MKKICLTIVAALFAVCANAQVYVGGNFGIASIDNGGDDDITVYSLLPEIGYKLNSEWAVGASLGWSKGGLQNYDGSLATTTFSTTHTFEVNPYVRYTFLQGKMVNVFCEGGVGYKHYNGADDVYSIGLKPGVELKMDKFSLITRLGFIGYEKNDNNDTSVWGMDFDSNNITLGIIYNF